jgi:opine dehydrogenase
VLIGETNTFPFASRCTEPGAAAIYGTKAEMLAAALAPHRTPELLDAFRPLLPMLQPAQSVLQTGFGNVGAILHPTITLMNRERIRSGDAFDFYTDGVTPEVAEVLAAADEERLNIARAFAVPVCSLPEWIASAYGHRADSMLKTVGGNPAYVGIKAPNTIVHRYLLEDVPTGLIPMLELGRAAGITAPTLRKLVDLACSVLEGRAWQWPRTLRTLGLEGLSVAQIRDRLEGGFKPSLSPRALFPRVSITVRSTP